MIAAVILAAGQSRRMGQPKLILPWGTTTVIGRVVTVLFQTGVKEIVVVTGAVRDQVAQALGELPVHLVDNPRYAQEEMLSSCQVGLAALPDTIEAALIVLGDQPQIEPDVVLAVLQAYQSSHKVLVVPSYQNHRGHPWLVDRSLWPEILSLHFPDTLRDFLHHHSQQIQYVPVETGSVLKDLDTPQDYQREQP